MSLLVCVAYWFIGYAVGFVTVFQAILEEVRVKIFWSLGTYIWQM